MTGLGVLALAAQVSDGSVPADSLVAAAAARIATDNPGLNAVVSSRAREALAEAAELTGTGRAHGPLAGIPFTAKDMLSTVDLPTTCGSRALEGYRTVADATAVARLREAGAVLMGKTNCPEFALGVDTTNELFGATRNPLGPWTPGGSSGGEAAAVASGMSLVGLGSDYGGSLRWPAQCAGLVGLRPTVGRVPRTGEQPGVDLVAEADDAGRSFQDTVQVVGPIGRTVEDVFAVLQVISGPDGQDHLLSDAPLLDFRDGAVAEVEVRWATTVAGVAVDPEVADAVASAARALGAAGLAVTQGVPTEVDLALGIYDRLRAAEPMAAIARLRELHPARIGSAIESMLASRITPPADELAELWARRDELVSGLGAWLTGSRVLVLPVSTDVPRDLAGRVADFHLLSPSRAISLFGVPAVSVPVAVSRTGSPVSVQVVAPAFREDVALAVGQLLADETRPVGATAREASHAS